MKVFKTEVEFSTEIKEGKLLMDMLEEEGLSTDKISRFIVNKEGKYQYNEDGTKNEDIVLYNLLINGNLGTIFKEFGEEYVIDALKGKSFIKKKVTIEYTVVKGDGVDRSNLNDEFINSLAGNTDTVFKQEGRFVKRK